LHKGDEMKTVVFHGIAWSAKITNKMAKVSPRHICGRQFVDIGKERPRIMRVDSAQMRAELIPWARRIHYKNKRAMEHARARTVIADLL